jgi:2-methylaconitate cis-trans-isomerase PrpF
LPKVSFISEPQNYIDMDKNEVSACDMDICVRAVSVGAVHKAYPITVAIGTGAASMIQGTIVNELVKPASGQTKIRLGHASGVTNVEIVMDGDRVVKGGVTRTARRIMDGYIYIRE